MDTGPMRPLRAGGRLELALIRAAQGGSEAAFESLLREHEPLLVSIVSRFFAPGVEQADLEQEARVGYREAVVGWDPGRGVPFRAFAALCARRQIIVAVKRANCRKHAVLSTATSMSAESDDGRDVGYRAPATSPAWADPAAVFEVREALDAIVERLRLLSAQERASLAGSLCGLSERAIGARTGGSPKQVNNALRRARTKLREADCTSLPDARGSR